MINENLANKYFFLLIVLLPVSIIIGPAVSLFNILLFDFSFLLFILIKKEFRCSWINNLIGLYLIYECFYTSKFINFSNVKTITFDWNNSHS